MDLINNPDQTLRELAIKHGVLVSTVRKAVYGKKLPYKRERGGQPALPAPKVGGYPETRAHRVAVEVEHVRELSNGWPEERAAVTLTNTFNRLGALWGDWIKK